MTEQEQIKAFEDLLKSLRKETSKENRQKIKKLSNLPMKLIKGVKEGR